MVLLLSGNNKQQIMRRVLPRSCVFVGFVVWCLSGRTNIHRTKKFRIIVKYVEIVKSIFVTNPDADSLPGFRPICPAKSIADTIPHTKRIKVYVYIHIHSK
jgi:hypothetical protein